MNEMIVAEIERERRREMLEENYSEFFSLLV